MSNLIGLDINILARYYVASEKGDSATQGRCELARKLVESDRALFVAKTVLLELERVLRGYYEFGSEEARRFLHISYRSRTLKLKLESR